MAQITAYARPNRLYRYRELTDKTIDRELEAIRKGYVFCPHFHEMNDPMEGSHRESVILKEKRNYKATITQVREVVSKLGIASFSEVYNHEPMWAHYAGRFSGICVAYSLRRLLQALPDDHELVRMSYTEEPPILVEDGAPAGDRARLVLSNKTLRWSSEREWRLIRPKKGPAAYHRTNVVMRVYLGFRTNPDHKRAVLNTLATLGIPALEMNIEQYQLSFRKMSKRTSKSK